MSRVDDETLQRYHDGDLPEAERERVAALVAADPEAQKKLEGLALTGGLLRAHLAQKAEQAPLEGLWERVQADIASADPAAPDRRPAAAQGSVWARLRAWLGASMGAHPLRWAGAGALAVVLAAVLALLLAGRARSPGDAEAGPEVARPVEDRVIIQDLDAPDRHPDVYEIRDGKRTTTVIWLHDDAAEEDGDPEGNPPARRDDI